MKAGELRLGGLVVAFVVDGRWAADDPSLESYLEERLPINDSPSSVPGAAELQKAAAVLGVVAVFDGHGFPNGMVY